MEMLATILIILTVLIFVILTTTVLTTYSDYPSYRMTYEFLKNKRYLRHRSFDGQHYYTGNARREVIKFANGSIKLLNDGYIHSNSPLLWFNPYGIYYYYKLHKLFKRLQIMEPREEDRQRSPQGFYWREVTTEMANQIGETNGWHVPTRVVVQQKPKEFKFLTKNQ